MATSNEQLIKVLKWPDGTDFDTVQRNLTEYLTDGDIEKFAQNTNIEVIQALVRAKDNPEAGFGTVANAADVDSKALLLSIKALNIYKSRLRVYRILASAMTSQDDFSLVDNRFDVLKKRINDAASGKKTLEQASIDAVKEKSQAMEELRRASVALRARDEQEAADRELRLREEREEAVRKAADAVMATLMGKKKEEDERRAALDRAKAASITAVEAQARIQVMFAGVVDLREYETRIAEIINTETAAHASADPKYRDDLINVNVTLGGLIYVTGLIAASMAAGSDARNALEAQVVEMQSLGGLKMEDLDAQPPSIKIDRIVRMFSFVSSNYELLRRRKIVLNGTVTNYTLLLSEKAPDMYPLFLDEYKKLFNLEKIEAEAGVAGPYNWTFRQMEDRVRRNLLGERYTINELEVAVEQLRTMLQTQSYSYYVGIVAEQVSDEAIAREREMLARVQAKLGSTAVVSDSQLRFLFNYIESEARKIRALIAGKTKAESLLARFRTYTIHRDLLSKVVNDLNFDAVGTPSDALPDYEYASFMGRVASVKNQVTAEANSLLEPRERITISRPGNLFMTEEETKFYEVNVIKAAQDTLAIVREVDALMASGTRSLSRFLVAIAKLNVASLFSKLASMRAQELQRAITDAGDAPSVVPPPLDPGYLDRMDRLDIDLTSLAGILKTADYRAEWSETAKRSKAVRSGAPSGAFVNENDLHRRRAVYIHELFVRKGDMGVKNIIHRVRQLAKRSNGSLNIDEFNALAKILEDCNEAVSKAHVSRGKEIDAGPEAALHATVRKQIAKYKKAYEDWTNTYPRFMQLGAALRRNNGKSLPRPDIRTLLSNSTDNIERIRRTLDAKSRSFKPSNEELLKSLHSTIVGTGAKKAALPPPGYKPPASAVPTPMPSGQVLGLEDTEIEMVQDLIGQTEDEVKALMEDGIEEDKAASGDASASPELAEDILNRMGTRWVPLEIPDVATISASDNNIAKFLYDFMPKLSTGVACIAWACALLCASDRDGVATLKKKAQAIRKKHQSIFPSRTSFSSIKDEDLVSAFNDVLESYTFYKLSFDQIVGKLRRRIARRFHAAVRLIVDSSRPADTFTEIFGDGAEIKTLFGPNADDVIKLLTENITAFQIVLAPEEVSNLKAIYINLAADLRSSVPLPADFSLSTVQNVVTALSDLDTNIALVQAKADAARTFDLTKASDSIYGTEVKALESDPNELAQLLSSALDPLDRVNEDLFPVIADIREKAGELETAIVNAGSDAGALQRVAKGISVEVARSRNVAEMFETMEAREGELKEDLWVDKLSFTQADIEQWVASVGDSRMSFQFDEELVGPSSIQQIDAAGSSGALQIKAQISSRRNALTAELEALPLLWSLSEKVYNVTRNSLMQVAMMLPRKGTRRARVFNSLIAYQTDETVAKLMIKYFAARRMVDPTRRLQTIEEVSTSATRIIDSIDTIVSTNLASLQSRVYLPISDKEYKKRMAAVKISAQDVASSGVDVKDPENTGDIAVKPLLVAAAKQATVEYSRRTLKGTAQLRARMATLSILSSVTTNGEPNTLVMQAARLINSVEFYNKGMSFVVGKAFIADGDKAAANVGAYSPIHIDLLTKALTLAMVLNSDSAEQVPDALIQTLISELRDSIKDAIESFAKSAPLKTPTAYLGTVGGNPITPADVSKAMGSVEPILSSDYNRAVAAAAVNANAHVSALKASAPPAPAPAPAPAVVTPPDLLTPGGSPGGAPAPAPTGPTEAEKDGIRNVLKTIADLLNDVSNRVADPTYEDFKSDLNAQRSLLEGLQVSGRSTLSDANATPAQYAATEAALRQGIVTAETNAADLAKRHGEAVMENSTKAQTLDFLKRTVAEFKAAIAKNRAEFDALNNGRGSKYSVDFSLVQSVFDIANASLSTAEDAVTRGMRLRLQELKDANSAAIKASGDFKTEYQTQFAAYESEVDREERQAQMDKEAGEDLLRTKAELAALAKKADADIATIEAEFNKLTVVNGSPQRKTAEETLASAKKNLASAWAAIRDPNADADALNTLKVEWPGFGLGGEVDLLTRAVQSYKSSIPPPSPAPATTPDPAPAPTPVPTPAAAASKVPPIGPAGTAAAAADAAAAAAAATGGGDGSLYTARDILTGAGQQQPILGIPADTANPNLAKILMSIATKITDASFKNESSAASTPRGTNGFYRAMFMYIGLEAKGGSRSLVIMFVPKGYDDPGTDRFTVVNSDTGVSAERDAVKRARTRRLVKYPADASTIAGLFPNHPIEPNSIPYKKADGSIEDAGFLVVAYAPIRNTPARTAGLVPEDTLEATLKTVARFLHRGWLGAGMPNTEPHEFLAPEPISESLYGYTPASKDHKGGLKTYTGDTQNRNRLPSVTESFVVFKKGLSSQDVPEALFRKSYGGEEDATKDSIVKGRWAGYAAWVMEKARARIDDTKKTEISEGKDKEADKHFEKPTLIGKAIGGGGDGHSDDSDWGFEEPSAPDSARIQASMPDSSAEKQSDAPSHWSWN